MATLQFYLFGNFRISYLDSPVADGKITRSVKSLLAYLLLNRHRIHPRAVLVGLFWGEKSEEKARCCLSTALWRLRRVLEPENTPKGTYIVTTSAGEIGFNAESDHWLDVAEFKESLSVYARQPTDRIQPQDLGKLEETLDLYTGDLLEGFYDNWTLRERERLRSLYLNHLTRLMCGYRQQGEYEKSLGCGHQILNLDPLREGVHRDIIRLYARIGHRALAVRQYETCCQILKSEIGVRPMAETQTLYKEILNQKGVPASPDGSRDFRITPLPETQIQKRLSKEKELRLAFDRIHSARKRLNRALRYMEELVIEGSTETE